MLEPDGAEAAGIGADPGPTGTETAPVDAAWMPFEGQGAGLPPDLFRFFLVLRPLALQVLLQLLLLLLPLSRSCGVSGKSAPVSLASSRSEPPVATCQFSFNSFMFKWIKLLELWRFGLPSSTSRPTW